MDFAFLAFIVGFPLLMGAILLPVAVLFRKANTVNCPICGQRIPKSAIRVTGVRCLRCDWSVVATEE